MEGGVQAEFKPNAGHMSEAHSTNAAPKPSTLAVRGPRRAPGVLGSDLTGASLDPKKYTNKVSH